MTKKSSAPDEVRLVAPKTGATTPRNPYTKYAPSRVTDFGESRTKQSFTDECDINNILSRYVQTGQIHHINERLAQFADVENIDFHQAQNLVVKANEMFAEIPAGIRQKFGHDPARFLEFALNPDNAPQMAAIGLIDPVDIPVVQGVKNAPTAHISSPEGAASPTQPVSASSTA